MRSWFIQNGFEWLKNMTWLLFISVNVNTMKLYIADITNGRQSFVLMRIINFVRALSINYKSIISYDWFSRNFIISNDEENYHSNQF